MDLTPGTTGVAFFSSYSGFMLSDYSIRSIECVQRGGLSVRVHPPIRIAPPTWRPVPQFSEASFQQAVPAAPSQKMLLRMAALPALNERGEPSLIVIHSDEGRDEKLPLDTFCVCVAGSGFESKGSDVAEGVLEELFVWLRVLTRQWWIGKPTEKLTGNKNLEINMTGENQFSGQPIAVGRQTTPSDNTLFVTQDIWAKAFNNLRQNKTHDQYEILKMEIYYAVATHDELKTLIYICSSVEMLRDDVLNRHGISKNSLQVSQTDILKQISIGFEKTLGKNMATMLPSEFAFLKACWVARGNLAHGKSSYWVNSKSVGKISDIAMVSASVDAIWDWMKNL